MLGLAWFCSKGFAQQCQTEKAKSSVPVRSLFVIAGQSNAVGLASVKDIMGGANDYAQESTVFRNVKIYGIYGAAPGVVGNDDGTLSKKVTWSDFATWQTARPGFGYKNVANTPQDFPSGSDAEDMFGPELYFAKFLNDHPPHDHYIVKLAVSNTTLTSASELDNWAPDGHLYKELMKMIANAHNTKRSRVNLQVAGLFFMQGETDALNEIWAKNYKNNLISFLQRFRQDVEKMGCTGGREVPVVLGRIQDNLVWTYRKSVRLAQQRVAQELPHVNVINTDDFARQLVVGGVHFNEYGQAHLGRRIYQAFFSPSSGVGSK